MQREVSFCEASSRWHSPERVVLAVSICSDGRADIIAPGWKMHTSGNAPMLAISVAPAATFCAAGTGAATSRKAETICTVSG